jgi:hypothetical protein
MNSRCTIKTDKTDFFILTGFSNCLEDIPSYLSMNRQFIIAYRLSISVWNLHLLGIGVNLNFRRESSIFRFTLIFYCVLTNLQLALKFVCPFVIRQGALCSNKVENLVIVIFEFCPSIQYFSNRWNGIKRAITSCKIEGLSWSLMDFSDHDSVIWRGFVFCLTFISIFSILTPKYVSAQLGDTNWGNMKHGQGGKGRLPNKNLIGGEKE